MQLIVVTLGFETDEITVIMQPRKRSNYITYQLQPQDNKCIRELGHLKYP